MTLVRLKTGRNDRLLQNEGQPVLPNVMEQPLVRMLDLVKVYQTAAGDFPALKGIHLEVGRGEFVGIVGKSGAGKSTLVNMITGVDHATSGEVWVGGVPVHTLDEDAMALWRGMNVGVIYQSFELMPSLTVLDNVMLPMDLCGLFVQGTSQSRAMDLLRMVEMDDQHFKLPGAVSGGQKQRAAIARSLANDPVLIVADEPTGNLDSNTSEVILQLFESLVQQGKTIIMVTHDQSLASRFSRVLQIIDGEISPFNENTGWQA
jgi:putative ABC transport system ATP-binding protein